jgi:hypothetical protein
MRIAADLLAESRRPDRLATFVGGVDRFQDVPNRIKTLGQPRRTAAASASAA